MQSILRNTLPSFEETTENIRVVVTPIYLDEQSNPDDDEYVWAYNVRIENHGEQTVQLMDRYWKITNALGRVEEVEGSGVVGEQPVLKPGESFEYTSGCPLSTPSGFMVGTYGMIAEDGRRLDVHIPTFSLDMPDLMRVAH